jgi:tetratricopeptide (TPR) repeat protein
MNSLDTSAKFTFSFQGKVYKFDFARAFLFGDALLSSGQFHAARYVFEVLGREAGHGPRAKIMLACCEAKLKHFAECASIIGMTFDDSGAGAEDLHSALVYQSIGMRADAIAALHKLAERFSNLPTLSLLLGDDLARSGDFDRARKAWNAAIKKDRPNGEVAIAAKRRLQADNKLQARRQ